jgi:hypothetical protein
VIAARGLWRRKANIVDTVTDALQNLTIIVNGSITA